MIQSIDETVRREIMMQRCNEMARCLSLPLVIMDIERPKIARCEAISKPFAGRSKIETVSS